MARGLSGSQPSFPGYGTLDFLMNGFGHQQQPWATGLVILRGERKPGWQRSGGLLDPIGDLGLSLDMFALLVLCMCLC